MRAIVLHSHRTINFWSKKKKKDTDGGPTKEQMIETLTRQIEYHTSQIAIITAIRQCVEKDEEIPRNLQVTNKV